MKTTEWILNRYDEYSGATKEELEEKWYSEKEVKKFVSFVEKYCDIDKTEKDYFKTKKKLFGM